MKSIVGLTITAVIAILFGVIASLEQRTFNAWSLVFNSAMLGAGLGFMIWRYWPATSWQSEAAQKFAPRSVLAFVCFVATIFGAFALNAEFPKGVSSVERLLVLGKSSHFNRSGMHYILSVSEHGRKQDIAVRKAQWQAVRIGDLISTSVSTGRLGYRFISERPVEIFKDASD